MRVSKLKTDTYIDKKIKEYFKANLPQYIEGDDAWSICWNSNMTFTLPDDLYWLEFTFKPGVPSQGELGNTGRNRWDGEMQIDICVPINEATTEESGDDEDDDTFGTSAMDTCYNDIAKVFKRGVTFDGIRIYKTYRNSSAMQVYEDFCKMPVLIQWRAYLSN